MFQTNKFTQRGKNGTPSLGVLLSLASSALADILGQICDYFKRMLDTEAQALMIPIVETSDQAHSAVAACSYPPLGSRECAAEFIRASDSGITNNYITTAHHKLFIALQIESIKGVDNTAEIATYHDGKTKQKKR